MLMNDEKKEYSLKLIYAVVESDMLITGRSPHLVANNNMVDIICANNFNSECIDFLKRYFSLDLTKEYDRRFLGLMAMEHLEENTNYINHHRKLISELIGMIKECTEKYATCYPKTLTALISNLVNYGSIYNKHFEKINIESEIYFNSLNTDKKTYYYLNDAIMQIGFDIDHFNNLIEKSNTYVKELSEHHKQKCLSIMDEYGFDQKDYLIYKGLGNMEVSNETVKYLRIFYQNPYTPIEDENKTNLSGFKLAIEKMKCHEETMIKNTNLVKTSSVFPAHLCVYGSKNNVNFNFSYGEDSNDYRKEDYLLKLVRVTNEKDIIMIFNRRSYDMKIMDITRHVNDRVLQIILSSSGLTLDIINIKQYESPNNDKENTA